MKVLVDGDSFPYIEKIEKVCEMRGVQLDVYHDYEHEHNLRYGEEHIVEIGRDAADIAIYNNAKQGDIIVTNDMGLALLGISKKCFVVDKHGRYVTKQLAEKGQIKRHMYMKAKGTGRSKTKGKAKSKSKPVKDVSRIIRENMCEEEIRHFNFTTSLNGLIDKAKEAEKIREK